MQYTSLRCSTSILIYSNSFGCQSVMCNVLPPHMSAEPKLCFSNYPKGGINIFQLRTTYWLWGYVSSNQTHLLFSNFALKMGDKWPKNGPKMSWFGMVGFGMAKFWFWIMAEPKKIAKLKVWFLAFLEELWNSLQKAVGFFCCFSDQFGSQLSQTKPYHTKPKHFRPIFRPFWPIFRAKVPTSKWIWFGDT